jgi:hypothetical protein
MTAPHEEVLKLQWLLPAGVLRIVAQGEDKKIRSMNEKRLQRGRSRRNPLTTKERLL